MTQRPQGFFENVFNLKNYWKKRLEDSREIVTINSIVLGVLWI